MSSRAKPNIGVVPVKPRSLDEALVVADNETYTVSDLELYDSQGRVRQTVSKTILHGNQQTRGHKHGSPPTDEIYYFAQGEGFMLLDNDAKLITAGDYVLVEGGVFHKIINTSRENDLVFICFYPGRTTRPPFSNVLREK